MLSISAAAGLAGGQRETRVRMTGFGAEAAPCCPSSLGYRGVGTARIGKIVAKSRGRWLLVEI
jgi:hypothetical protein